MTSRFLVWAIQRTELPFNKMRKAVGADLEWGVAGSIENQELL